MPRHPARAPRIGHGAQAGVPSGERLLTVERAIQVLRVLGDARGGLRLAEVARAARLDRTIVRRILTTCAAHRLVAYDGALRTYRLGTLIQELAWSSQGGSVREAARPAMTRLAAGTGETIWLAVADGVEAVCVDEIESPQILRVVLPIGYRHPLWAGAAGKAILAYYSPEERAAVIAQSQHLGGARIRTDARAVEAACAHVRQLGYAWTEGELYEGAAGLSAPVFDAQGRAVGSLGVVGPAARLAGVDRAALARAVMRAAADASARLGYRAEGA